MISESLLEELQQLSKEEKLRIAQLMINDVAGSDFPLKPDATYEIWSPYDSAAAANDLLRLLEEGKSKPQQHE